MKMKWEQVVISAEHSAAQGPFPGFVLMYWTKSIRQFLVMYEVLRKLLHQCILSFMISHSLRSANSSINRC